MFHLSEESNTPKLSHTVHWVCAGHFCQKWEVVIIKDYFTSTKPKAFSKVYCQQTRSLSVTFVFLIGTAYYQKVSAAEIQFYIFASCPLKIILCNSYYLALLEMCVCLWVGTISSYHVGRSICMRGKPLRASGRWLVSEKCGEAQSV